MKPLFGCLIEIETLAPPRALDKLARAGVFMYEVRQIGKTRVRLYVKSKEIQKIFAIFSGSCYTVRVIRESGLKRPLTFLKKRPGIIVGAVLFFASCFLSAPFVLKIEYVGTGSHYAREAEEILHDSGISIFAPFDKERAEQAERRLSLLPSVSFCSVEKSGYVVTVTLEENAETPLPERETSLVSPVEGKVEDIIVLRGQVLVAEGDVVEAGQTLVSGAENVAFPVARVELLCTSVFEYISQEESDEAKKEAFAGALLYIDGEVITQSAEVRHEEDKFIYTVHTEYRRVLTVNLAASNG